MNRKQIAIIITMIIIITSTLYSCHKSLPSIEELSTKDLSFQEWEKLGSNISIVIGSGDQKDFILQKMFEEAATYNEYRITYEKEPFGSFIAQLCLAEMLGLSDSYEDAYYVFQAVSPYYHHQYGPLKKMTEFANTTSEWKVIWKNTRPNDSLNTMAMNEIAKLAKTKAF